MAYWEAVLQNAIGCTIGSLAAIVATFLVYYLGTDSARKEKEQERARNEREAYELFVLLVRNVCQASVTLIKNITKFSQELQKSPANFPELKYVPLNDFKRLSELQDLQKFLFSYTNRFQQGKSAVKDFVSIMAKTDYLQAQFNAIPQQVEKGAAFHQKRQQDLKKLIEQVDDSMKNMMSGIPPNHIFFLAFAPIISPYALKRQQQPQAPLSFHITQFVDPVYNELVRLQNQVGLNTIQQNIKSMASEALSISTQIPQQNRSLAVDISKTLVDICEAAEDLKGLADRMN